MKTKSRINRHVFTSRSEEWGTPQHLYDELNNEFFFQIDLAASAENFKHPNYVDKKQDALRQDWHQLSAVGFCNPPYGYETAKFVKKAFEESRKGFTTVMLVKSATDTIWWHTYVIPHAEVRFIKGRLKFVGKTKSGEPEDATFASAIVIFRGEQQ